MKDELSLQLSELAKKLGTSVDQLYAASIKQAKIQLIYEVIHFFIFAGLTYGLYEFYLFLPEFDKNTEYLSLIEIAKIMSMLGVFLLSVSFILSIPSTIKEIITLYKNPEYWAMQDILASINLSEE